MSAPSGAGSAARSIVYETGGQARIEVDIAFGAVRLITSPRSTTAVSVVPASVSRRQDVDLTGAVRVDFVAGVVSVGLPHRGVFGSLWRPGAVDVLIAAPVGSSIRADVGYAAFAAEGALGQCRVRSSYGDVRFDEADEAVVKTSGGQVRIGAVRGSATISNSYGPIHLGHAQGRCDLRNSAGDIEVGAVCGGAVAIRSAYGQVTVERAESGSLEVVTSYGATEIGVPGGTAVRLDVATKNGRVVNSLTPSPPRQGAATLELRVRSGWGDIAIRRAQQPEPGSPEPGSPEPGSPEPGSPEPGSPEPSSPEPSSPEPSPSEGDR